MKKIFIFFTFFFLFFFFIHISIFYFNQTKVFNNQIAFAYLYEYTFPTEGLEVEIEFWKDIFTKYSEKQVLVHDAYNLGIIYEVVTPQIPLFDLLPPKTQDKYLENIKIKYKNILLNINKKQKTGEPLDSEEERVYLLVKNNKSSYSFVKAAENVRLKTGASEKFKEGLIRSGRYISKFREIFLKHGLPEELAYLPHIESSFKQSVVSHAGAVGMWQIMKSTGASFLKINDIQDERLDPYFACEGAAKILKRNYNYLKSWPLAITAYNHGLSSMIKAKQTYGNDIVKIIHNYKHPSFRFAGRNFYPEFLAAYELASEYWLYFPYLKLDEPEDFDEFTLTDYLPLSTILEYFNITIEEFRRLNPSYLEPVLKGKKYIPAGSKIRFPAGHVFNFYEVYNSIPKGEIFSQQRGENVYYVQKGDSLSKIANKLGVSLKQLMEENDIKSPNYIYPGQKLKIPEK